MKALDIRYFNNRPVLHFARIYIYWCQWYICVFQSEVSDVFRVFLANGDMKSFTYNQQTTVAVNIKAHVTCRFTA